MSKLYLFAIGGTGSRVLRSLTMFLSASVKINVNEVVPIIIDPDSANADLTRTVTLMDNYIKIRKELSFGATKNKFFETNINKTLNNFILKLSDTDNKTFKQFIDLPQMSNANQAFTKILFSEKNLSSSLSVGFKGNPNIGSVVLNQIVSTDDFNDFANSFEAGDKIFIISSIFGGTGASGFPLLLKTLRTTNSFPNWKIINEAEIGAITILPYFKLEQKEDSEIDSTTFISKTKSALAYYEKNIIKSKQINALYYLADDISNTYENHEGGTSQQNQAHLIEFLAATAIVDFANKSHRGDVTNKELGIKDTENTVSFNCFYEELQQMLKKPLTQFVLMANCFKHKYKFISSSTMKSNRLLESNFYNNEFISYLKRYLESYLAWLSELQSNNRSLEVFNLSCGDKPFDIIAGETPRRIWSKYSNYDLFFSKINSIKVSQGLSSSNQLMERYYLATEELVGKKFKL